MGNVQLIIAPTVQFCPTKYNLYKLGWQGGTAKCDSGEFFYIHILKKPHPFLGFVDIREKL